MSTATEDPKDGGGGAPPDGADLGREGPPSSPPLAVERIPPPAAAVRRRRLIAAALAAALAASLSSHYSSASLGGRRRRRRRERGRRRRRLSADPPGGACPPDAYLYQSSALPAGCADSDAAARGGGDDDDGGGRFVPRVVDVLSIGSLERLSFLDRQRNGWASDPLVRYFWGASELDDSDPTCSVAMEMEDVVRHAVGCHRSERNATFAMDFYRREEDPFGYVMKRKGNVPGWFCAQRRQGQSLARVGAMYRNLTAKGGSLPDYLLLVDDDTYINLPLLTEYLSGTDASIPAVHAGCVFPKVMSFGFGGFGLFYSRGAVARMIKPVRCDGSETGFDADVCVRVRENLLEEAGPAFVPGSSVTDLMASLSASDGLCMHSDWLTGYFVNVYGLSRYSSAAPVYQRFGYDRLHALSGIIFGAEFKAHIQNMCDSARAIVCHKVTPHPGETEAEAAEKDRAVASAVAVRGGDGGGGAKAKVLK